MTVVQRRQAERLKESLAVAAELEKEHLGLPRKPRSDYPELTSDLSDLEDAALIELLVKLTRWADFSGGQLALAEVDERFAESLVAKLKAFGLVETYSDGEDETGPRGGKVRKNITVARASKELDESFQQARQEHLNAYARRKLLTARHEAFERDAAVVSRELSRRIERDPSQRRTARYGGAK
jgi:hypothetical protein